MMMDLHNQTFLNKPESKPTAHQLLRHILLVAMLILPLLFYSYANDLLSDLESDTSRIQKEITEIREETTNLQIEYSKLLSPQEIESSALAMGMTSANSDRILVLEDLSDYEPDNLYADLVENSGERME